MPKLIWSIKSRPNQKYGGAFLKIPSPWSLINCILFITSYLCLKIKYHFKTLETPKVACLYFDGWTCENTTGDNLFLPLDLDENRVNFLGSWAAAPSPLKRRTIGGTTTFCPETLRHFFPSKWANINFRKVRIWNK